MKSIDIVIPVFDEEKKLYQNVIEASEKMNAIFSDISWRLIIVDNGSKDCTFEIAKKCETINNVTAMHISEAGKGRAIKEVWNVSRADVLGFFDLDLSTDLIHLEDVKKLMQNPDIDVISGSRLIEGASVQNRGVIREFISRSSNYLLRTYLEIDFTDASCGFKFIRNDKYKAIEALLNDSNKWFFSVELLVWAEKNLMNVIELPVNWIDDRESKVKIFSVSFEYLKSMFFLKKRLTEYKLIK